MNQQYKKNFLSQVIARVDFSTPLPGVADSLPGDVAKLALAHFPISEPRKRVGGSIKFDPQGNTSTEKLATITLWQYHGKERTKSLLIAQDFMFVVYNRYENLGALKTDFLPILKALFKRFPEDMVVNRFGLRYINNIPRNESDPTQWNKYLDPAICALFEVKGNPGGKTQICRALNNIEWNNGQFNLKFRYGMHNPDYPAPLRSKDFILDFDAYSQGRQDESEITTNLDRFYVDIKNLFEASITEELRQEMRG